MLFRSINIITYYCLAIAFYVSPGIYILNQISFIVSNIIYIITKLQVIHVHPDINKMFMTLFLNDQQSFYLHHFDIIILLRVCFVSVHRFIIQLLY